MRNKYGAVKVHAGGVTFDSKHEYERWLVLRDMQNRHEIIGLERQQRFQLIPAQRYEGKIVERAVIYIADFVYVKDGKLIVEDAKGYKTKEYIIKRKLMLERYGVRIKEV